MAKKSTPAPPPVGPFVLTGLKSDFKATLENQIAIGKDIKARPIRSQIELNEAEGAYTIWDNFNSAFLGTAFTDERKRKEYEQSGPSSFRITRDWRGEYDNFIRRVSGMITGLESILGQLQLFQEPQAVATLSVATRESNLSAYSPTNMKVFLVHGHDHGRRSDVKNVIHDIKLQPVILDGEPSQGMTVIEKFEKHGGDASYAVIIATADDEGYPRGKPEQKKLRARQNVIGEFFWFMGRLGRGKVAVLYESGVELPSDTGGICYIELDASGAWKFKLARELKAAGFNVELDKLNL